MDQAGRGGDSDELKINRESINMQRAALTDRQQQGVRVIGQGILGLAG